MLYASNTFVSYNHPLEEADIVFLGVPFASTSVSAPAIYGPLMVRESLKLTEDYVNGKNLFAELKVCDLGDLEVVPGSYDLTAQRIRETIADIRSANRHAFLVFIGGEHLITLPVVESLRPKTIVQLDAHADCRRDYLGNAHMHQTWAYHASKLAQLVQLGVTTLNREEEEVRKEHGIQHFSLEEFVKAKPSLAPPVHLSIDIDVLAGTATGLPEGRAQLHDVLSAIDAIECSSLDICEIADNALPSRTGFMAAHILMRALAKKV